MEYHILGVVEAAQTTRGQPGLLFEVDAHQSAGTISPWPLHFMQHSSLGPH